MKKIIFQLVLGGILVLGIFSIFNNFAYAAFVTAPTTLNQVPLTSPGDRETGVVSQPTFVWSSVSDANGYYIEVRTSNSVGLPQTTAYAIFVFPTAASSFSYQPSYTLQGTYYLWCIVAIKTQGATFNPGIEYNLTDVDAYITARSPECQTYSDLNPPNQLGYWRFFTTQQGGNITLNPPQIVSPANGATVALPLVLQWSGSQTGLISYYNYEVKKPDGTYLVQNGKVDGGSNLQKDLGTSGIYLYSESQTYSPPYYYWRVRACSSASVCSNWTNFIPFKVTLASPANLTPNSSDVNSPLTTPPILRCDVIPGATAYRWQVYLNGQSMITPIKTTSNSLDLKNTSLILTSPSSYEWTVQGILTRLAKTGEVINPGITLTQDQNIDEYGPLSSRAHFVYNQAGVAPTVTLSANPTELPVGGGTVTLSWTSTNANSLSIDQGVGGVTPVDSGQKQVSVTQPTTFTITATGPGGSKTASVSVSVGGTPPPPTLTAPTNLSPCNTPSGVFQSPNPTLSWQGQADYFQVHLDEWPNTILLVSSGNSLSLTPDYLAARGLPQAVSDGTHIWYVEACNYPNQCLQSESCYFAVMAGGGPGPGGGTANCDYEGSKADCDAHCQVSCKDTGGGKYCCPKGCGGEPCPPNAICNPLKVCNFEQAVSSVINFFFWIALALTPLMIVIGGIYLLTAAGDPRKVATGRMIIFYTLIGVAIIFFAKGLVALLRQIIGG